MNNFVFDEFSPKDPTEIIVLTMDFTDILLGESIVSCVCTMRVVSRSDPAAASMISGAADISGSPFIRQEIINGVDGAVYHLSATVVTDSARPRKLVGTGVLRCILGA